MEIPCEMQDAKPRGLPAISSPAASTGGGMRKTGESQRAARARGLCAEVLRRRGARWLSRGGGVLWCCGGAHTRPGLYRRGSCSLCNPHT